MNSTRIAQRKFLEKAITTCTEALTEIGYKFWNIAGDYSKYGLIETIMFLGGSCIKPVLVHEPGWRDVIVATYHPWIPNDDSFSWYNRRYLFLESHEY